jgi:hypothetical protein
MFAEGIAEPLDQIVISFVWASFRSHATLALAMEQRSRERVLVLIFRILPSEEQIEHIVESNKDIAHREGKKYVYKKIMIIW